MTEPYVLLPVPYQRPEELLILEVDPSRRRPLDAAPTPGDLQARQELFVDVAVMGGSTVEQIRVSQGAQFWTVAEVSPNFFQVLGVPTGGPDLSGGPPPGNKFMVLTGLGARALGPAVNAKRGEFETTNGGGLLVCGQLPDGFIFPDLAASRTLNAVTISSGVDSLPQGQYRLIARLQRGVRVETALAALNARNEDANRSFTVTALADYMRRDARPLTVGATVAGIVILLVSAANLSCLVSARRASFDRDALTRVALGASQKDVAVRWLVELSLLTGCGLVLGLLLASASVPILHRTLPAVLEPLAVPSVSYRVWVLGCLAALSVGVAGWLPFSTGAARWRRSGWGILRYVFPSRATVLIAAQSSLVVILGTAGGALVKSYVRMMLPSSGFDERATAATVLYPRGLDDERLRTTIADTVALLKAAPGIAEAGATNAIIADPVFTRVTNRRVSVRGVSELVSNASVTPGFMEAAGMQFVEGRALRHEDGNWSGVVVNTTYARKHWPTGGAIGAPIVSGKRVAVVVGVVVDPLFRSRDEASQSRIFSLAEDGSLVVTFAIKAAGENELAAEDIRTVVTAGVRDAVVVHIGEIGQRLRGTVRDKTFASIVLGVFGVAGLAMSCIGLVGVVIAVVAARAKEIAIRQVLGASLGGILMLVTRQCLRGSFAGAAGGVMIGHWLSRVVAHHVYGVETPVWSVAVSVCVVTVIAYIGTASVAGRLAMRGELVAKTRLE